MIAQWQVQQAQRAQLEEKGVRYAWIVTHEYEEDGWEPVAEIAGPRDVTDAELVQARDYGSPFRIDYDGDGPACMGLMWASDTAHPRDSFAAFAPLEDFGRGNYGATAIFYSDAANRWVEL